MTAEQLGGLEAAAMDLGAAYPQWTVGHVSAAASKVAHDPFHLVQYMNEAVNEVRKAEHRRLSAAGDGRLKGTRPRWLYGMENGPVSAAARFNQVKFINLQSCRAWAIKDVFRAFWLCADVEQAREHFDPWYGGRFAAGWRR